MTSNDKNPSSVVNGTTSMRTLRHDKQKKQLLKKRTHSKLHTNDIMLNSNLPLNDDDDDDDDDSNTRHNFIPTQYRVRKMPRLKIIFKTVNWLLPHDIDEANSLNPNVKFFYTESDDDIYDLPKKKPFANNIKIKYNPQLFLNFKKLLNSSEHDPLIKQDDYLSDAYLDNFTNKNGLVDLIMENTYKSVYPVKKKNYFHVTPMTIPTKDDRQLFKSLLLKSEGSKFINSNITMTFSQNSKELNVLKRPYKSSNVKYISINNHEIKALYPSPYPEHINKESIIHICELCLHYTSSRLKHYRHKLKCNQCKLQRPPGNEIYRDGKLSIFEVDGREYKTYSQNLCLLSMLFLKSKTLYYEVQPFIFYVLYEHPDPDSNKDELQLIGYFSKEKLNSTNYNLSCILTLPTHRRRGFGFLLMEFSYLLSKREFKQGTPEKPLSDLGLLTYRTFWKIKCLQMLIFLRDETNFRYITLEDLSNLMGMSATDIVLGLEQLRVLFCRDNEDGSKRYCISVNDWEPLDTMYKNWKSKNPYTIKPEKLLWKTMIFGPSCGVNAINTNLTDTLISDRNVSTNNDVDIFNKHINLITSFMTDDIDNDHIYMEIETLNKLKSQDNNINVEHDNFERKWKLCFQEAKLNISTVNKFVNKMKQKKEKLVPREEIHDSGDNRDDEVDTTTILEDMDVIEEEEDDEYNEDIDQDGDDDDEKNDDDDDDDEVLEDVIPESEDSDDSIEEELQELLDSSVA